MYRLATMHSQRTDRQTDRQTTLSLSVTDHATSGAIRSAKR